jgi:hypothetical protein
MNWEIIQESIFYPDGSWRDVHVRDITRIDWIKFIDYVNENFKVEFYSAATETGESKINFEILSEYWDGKHSFLSCGRITVYGIELHFPYFFENEIECYVDPSEINDSYKVDILIESLQEISKLLARQVILSAENMPEVGYILVNEDTVVINV